MSETPETIIAMGRQADALLGDDELWSTLRANFLAVIEHSQFDQAQEREEAYRMIKAIEAMQNVLRRRVNDAVKLKKETTGVTH